MLSRQALFRWAVSAALALPPARAAAWDLFHPAPAGQLREMQSDRPDRTEGPFTVDAGHLQFEADLLGYSRAQGEGARVEALRILPFNLKLGLTDRADFETVVETYSQKRSSADDGTLQQDAQGFGDVTLRLKLNFFGATEAEGAWASGFIGFIKFPTANADLGDQAREGGFILPQDFRLPLGFELGVMGEMEVLQDQGGSPFSALDTSTSLSHGLYKDLGAFVEYYSQHDLRAGAELEQSADAGVSLGLGDDASVDAGVNVGLPRAQALDIFAGLTVRL